MPLELLASNSPPLDFSRIFVIVILIKITIIVIIIIITDSKTIMLDLNK